MPPLNSPDVGPLHGYDVRLTDPEPPPPPPAPPIVEILEELPADHDDDDPVREATERRRRSFDRSRRWDDEDDDASPYIAHAPEVQDEERAPKELVKPTEMEMRLIRRDDSRRKPRRAWTADLYLFLLHPAASSSLIWLTLLCFCVGGLVRIMREFRPAVDG